MKKLKKLNLVFVFLSIVILIACVLAVILREDAAITLSSTPAIVFGVCSVIYAAIAFLNKKKHNLFALGESKLFFAFYYSLKDDRSDADSDEYKKEFALSAFIFCALIPLYIPLAFFAKSFYQALALALAVTVLRCLLILGLVLTPRIIKKAQDKKLDLMKDEPDRKEQERRESMGKWK